MGEMGKINIGRWLLAGIITGIIIDIIEGVLNGVILADQWTAAMKDLGKPALNASEVIMFNIYGLILGLTAAWFYAAIRPRFGAGPMTAVYAAIAIWVPGYLLANAVPAILDILPARMMAILIVVGFFEIIVATLAGTYFYKEEA